MIWSSICAGWFWWFYVQVEPSFRPDGLLRGTLIGLEAIELTVALIMAPAVLGGTLAAEKSRGTLGMLLIARVSAYEIVAARLISRLCQVLTLLAAGLPLLLLVAGLLRQSLWEQMLLLLLPAAVTFGAGGVAIAASSMARRARDALLAVYLLGIVLISGPPLLAALVWTLPLEWIAGLNPFSSLVPLIWHGDPAPAWMTIGWWCGMGAAGTTWAAVRLRPAYLRQISGEGAGRSARRVAQRPPVADAPMLWKELHIERMRAFGRVARGLGWLVGLLVAGATLWLVGTIEWHRWVRPDRTAADWGVTLLRHLMSSVAWPLCWLIQWAVGLRAAVTVAQEREQATWDALLASPLDGREIIAPKIRGSLYALRWLLIVVLAAWTISLAYGAMRPRDYAFYLTQTVVVSGFMAVIGVWSSLVSSTTTRAMTLTLGLWLAASAATAAVAVLLAMLFWLIAWYVWLVMINLGTSDFSPQGFGRLAELTAIAFVATRLVSYLAAGIAAAVYLRVRFDYLAGRGSHFTSVHRARPAQTACG
ncbi:MAG: hypothetical protein HY000_34605 [Planctomycetes bacterium]|nr:hypothetical protein [Planctomycetota bacterium]